MRRLLLICFSAWFSMAAVAPAQTRIPWIKSYPQAQREAAAKKRLILLHFWNHNCPPCARLERNVFNKPEVIRALATNYVPVKVLVAENRQLAEHFKVDRWPTDIFVDANGRVLHRTISSQSPSSFVHILDKVAATSRVGRTVGDLSQLHDGREATGGSFDRGSGFQPGTTAAQGPLTSNYQPRNAATNPAYGQRPTTTDRPPIRPTAAAPQSVTNAFLNQPRNGGSSGGGTTLTVGDNNQAANSNGLKNLGLDGFCPVKLYGSDQENPRWMKGNRQFGIYHRNKLYLFCCAECLDKFKAAPDKYAPILSGYDIIKYLETGRLVAGQRAHGLAYRGHIYLFSDETSLGTFIERRAHYADAIMKVLRNNLK